MSSVENLRSQLIISQSVLLTLLWFLIFSTNSSYPWTTVFLKSKVRGVYPIREHRFFWSTKLWCVLTLWHTESQCQSNISVHYKIMKLNCRYGMRNSDCQLVYLYFVQSKMLAPNYFRGKIIKNIEMESTYQPYPVGKQLKGVCALNCGVRECIIVIICGKWKWHYLIRHISHKTKTYHFKKAQRSALSSHYSDFILCFFIK